MRAAVIWLLILVVTATNFAVAADSHVAAPATVATASVLDPCDGSGQPPCQICLHGPALTLLPQGLCVIDPGDRPAAPAALTRGAPLATPPDRIDEPPRALAR